MSYFGKVYLVGRDAAKAADWIFSADLHKSGEGHVVYTCILNERGGTESDLTVARLDRNDRISHSTGPHNPE